MNDVKEVLSRKDANLDAKAKLREVVSYLNEQLERNLIKNSISTNLARINSELTQNLFNSGVFHLCVRFLTVSKCIRLFMAIFHWLLLGALSNCF